MTEVKIIGMRELIDKLHKMEDVPNKVGNKALKQAGKHMLAIERSTAKSIHKKYATGKGAAALKVGNVKTYGSGNKYVGVGFTKDIMGDKSNWDNIKGLYFNHYGFYNVRYNTYVAGSNWLGKAYKSGVDECYSIMKMVILEELKL